MNDQSKTKQVLIQELTLLKQRIKEMERSESEYQQMKKKLREIEKQLLAIYELSSDVIYTLNCDFRPISISSSVERQLGYCAEELIGKPFNDLNIIAPESLEAAFKDALEVLSGGTVPAAEYVFIRKDGSRLIAEVSGSPLMEDGKIIGVISVARDITDRKQAEEKLRESENRYRFLFNYAVDGMVVGNAETGELTDCNQALCRMVERDRTELIGQHQSILHPENDLENGLSTSFRVHQAGDKAQIVEDRLVSKSGKIIPVEINATKIRIGEHEHLLGIFRDITERKLAEEALRESHERQRLEQDRLELILKTAQDGFWLVDASTGHLVEINEAAASMLGYTREELLTSGLADIDAQWSPEELGQEMQKIKTTGNALFTTRHYVKGGQIIDVEISVNYMPATNQFFSFIRDITERRRTEEKILYLATHDTLTGLPNRSMFSQLLNHAIPAAQRYQRQFAVLFIDLDRFKIINDTLGHEAGDQLLQEIATRLKQSLRASDVVARQGGDEFVILIEEVSDLSQVATVAHKILTSIVKPVTLMGQECHITASIGICMYPKDAEDGESLIKNADIAMYLAKEEGKNNYQFYSKDIQAKSLERQSIEANLRFALERNELSLHYQAKVDFKTNAITGVEALLRWQNPYLGSVTPTQFLPVAEETGLIVSIGKWVMKAACAQNVAWQQQGLPAVCMAVNLSLLQLMDDNLIDDIRTALNDSGMAPNLLELEITESMVMHNPTQMITVLAKIKSLGVRLALDDFGTSYSSLSKIKHFPIDTLKIDRSLIRNVPQDAEDKAITAAIIAMGKALSLTVVAEGVETVEQMNFLKDHSCNEMQGYYFSKPIIPEQFADLLRKHILTEQK